MVAHHVQEGFTSYEFARTIQGVAIASRRLLLGNESRCPGQMPRRLRVTGFVTGKDHDADFADIRREGLFNQDAQNGFFRSVVDESLQRKCPLIASRCGNHSLSDPHVDAPLQGFASGRKASYRTRLEFSKLRPRRVRLACTDGRTQP